VKLTQEELLWCSGASAGKTQCEGGWMSKALEWIAEEGISTELCIP